MLLNLLHNPVSKHVCMSVTQCGNLLQSVEVSANSCISHTEVQGTVNMVK